MGEGTGEGQLWPAEFRVTHPALDDRAGEHAQPRSLVVTLDADLTKALREQAQAKGSATG